MLRGVPAPFGLGELCPLNDTPSPDGVENPLGGRPSVDREPGALLKYDVDPPSDKSGVLGEMGVNDGETSADDFGREGGALSRAPMMYSIDRFSTGVPERSRN